MSFEKLKMLMDELVEKDYAPGNTVTVFLEGKEIFNYSCGYSDLENALPMTGNEYLYMYSCSKIATVTAAMQLLERGKILLTDPLYDYIPEYKEMYVKNKNGEIVPAKKPITIQNLFNMTAGLSYDTNTEAFKKANSLTNGKMNTDTVVRCLSAETLLFEPGDMFNYSLCHDVLGGLVEVVSGKKFREYVLENIFKPLDMKQSSYHLTPEIKKCMAKQYRFVENQNSESFDMVKAQQSGNARKGTFIEEGYGNSLIFGDEYDSGGAGIISTVQDYVKLASALANYGMGLNGERILSPSSVDLMRTNTLNESQLKSFNWKQLSGYGYGLGVRTMIDKAKGGSLGNVGEFGWGGAAGTSVFIDPQINLAAVYAKHTLNPREEYYQPRVRNTLYACL